MAELKPGVNVVGNKEYHADQKYLSSSNFKMLLENSEAFYNSKILGNRTSMSSTAMTEGSLVHAMILEPHLVAEEFVFFEGWRKAGKDFDSFKLQNPDMEIISKPQKVRCDKLVEVYGQRPEAVNLISGGKAEHTICTMLRGVPTKVRYDYINEEKGYLVDIKTTAYPATLESFQMTMDKYRYDLSAALYLDVAEQFYGKPFEFYFVVLGKKDEVCEVYKASKETLERGRMSCAEAVVKYKKCLETGDWSNGWKPSIMEIDGYEILEV